MTESPRPLVRLADICQQISSGGTPSRKHPEYFAAPGAGHLWVRSQELVDRPIWTTGERISDAGLANSSAKYYPQDTILLAMYGATVGKLALLQVPATVNQAICALRPDPALADFRYVYYALLETRTGLTSQAMGAAQQNLNQDLIRNFEIPLPALSTQIRVGSILSTYDELIEINTRRIEILEEMAQALHREWFVEFRYPGHGDLLLVDSELGPIPEGWVCGSVGEASDLVTRGVSPKYDDSAESLVINQKCIRSRRLSLEPARRHVTRVPDAKVVRFGDVLINSTGVGTLGRVAQVYRSLADTTVDSHVTIVRPKPEVTLPDFLGMALLDREAEFEAMGAGSTGQTELSRARVSEAPMALPPVNVQEEFGAVVGPMRCLAETLASKSVALRQARDLLLPRLISGEVDVSGLDADLGGLVA